MSIFEWGSIPLRSTIAGITNSMAQQLPHHIFRAYDIRGKAETEVSEEFCRLAGKGFGSELCEKYNKGNPTVIVGRDARTHSPKLEAALIEGLTSTGCHVKMIGEVPSPVNYFAICHFGCDGSVQVTASHNPKDDNGLKLQIRGAESFSGDDLQKLRKKIEKERFVEGDGGVEEVDVVTPYKEKIKSIIPPMNDMKIVADFGNGVAGPIYGSILKELGVELIKLYAEPDGDFPNHIANPSNHETLDDLIKTVKSEKADCGIAFDGDGDRVGFVDENGNVVSPDYLLLLLAEDYLKRNPGDAVIYTVSMSSILETEVKKFGGKPVMTVVGHSFVEHAMREHNSHLGGEQSGHFFCGEDYFDFDDAMVAALRVLSIFQEESDFSTLFSNYPRIFPSPEWRPHCPDEKKTEIVQSITKHFEDEGYPVITIDGARIDFGDGAWAGIRQSNTSPKLSVCVEARTEEKLKEIDSVIREHLATYPEIK